MAYFSVNNCTLRIANQLLLKDVCFKIETPSLIAIIGHNGVGKTTFLKSLTGQAPYEGLLRFKDFDFSYPKSLPTIHYAYLEQNTPINFDIPVLDIVVMGNYQQKKFLENYSKEDYIKAQEAINQVGMTGFENKSIKTLSGGELRLTFLAQMLVKNADLLLLDEPTNALDIRNKTKVMNILKQLSDEGKGIIFTTHDLDYLIETNGYLINFSEKKPQLEIISYETILKHKALLMQQ